MPVTMSDRTCAVARCTEFLATTNKTGVCGPHQRRYGSAAKALAAGNAAAPVKRAQKSKAPELVVEGPASPPAIDLEPVASPGPDLAALSLEELLILRRSVEAQLRARRDRARDEASRIERELGADAGRAEAA